MAVTDLRTPARLVDLGALDAEQILLVHNAEQTQYDTAAFDPEGKHLRFYRRGFSVWSGFPGAGKTTLIRQTICQMLLRDRPVFLASLEEDWHAVLVRLAATAAGVLEPSVTQLKAFLHSFGALLFLWTEEGSASWKKLLDHIRLLADGEGLQHAFIDSLMCLDVANDDFEAQRHVANQLAVTARATRCHIHLVAHPRKLVSSDQEPDLNDVAGAREIGGLADNVVFIRRMKDSRPYGSGNDCTPMAVSIRKQRHFDGSVGDVTGWFHRQQRQFHVEQFSQPTRYLPDWAYE